MLCWRVPGAEAPSVSEPIFRGLKPPAPSGMAAVAPMGVGGAAAGALAGAEALVISAGFSARLRSCPVTKLSVWLSFGAGLAEIEASAMRWLLAPKGESVEMGEAGAAGCWEG